MGLSTLRTVQAMRVKVIKRGERESREVETLTSRPKSESQVRQEIVKAVASWIEDFRAAKWQDIKKF